LENSQNEKTGLLFVHLITSFQTAAMQQLGKIPNPVSGKIERDLPQASMTIDMIDMIKTKCKGNLTDEEDKYLQHIISELKLNYVDEIGRSDKSGVSPEKDPSDSEKEDDINGDDNSAKLDKEGSKK